MDIAGTSFAVNNRLIPADALMVSLAEHFDPFLVDWQQRHPSIFRDLLPKGTFKSFNGATQSTYVFRGSLGVQAGLADWSLVEESRKPSGNDVGYDKCTYNPRTYTWAYDIFTNSGLKTSWRSPIFCVNDLRNVDEAKRQLGMIIAAGTEVADQTREVYARESYVKTAVDAGKGLVLVSGGGVNYIDDSDFRFSYDPFATDADGDTYITFKETLLERISTLNWSQLDLIKAYLSDQCPEAAIATDSGMPIFGLMLDIIDFEKMVYADDELREDFRFARPQQLISGFNMGFKVYRGFALTHDRRQMRYKISAQGAAGGNVTAKRVLPRRLRTAASVIGHAPETNPEYLTAELAIGIMFITDCLQIQVPETITNLGAGMVFAPQPGFNGEWTWLNIQDAQDNMLNEKGFFFSRFEYHLQPLRYAQEVTVFLYRRCPQALRTVCVADEDSAAGTSATAVEAPVTGDFSAANNTLVLTLNKSLAGGIGSSVTIAGGSGGTFSATIASDAKAPTYTFTWLAGCTNEPTAYTEFATYANVVVTVV